MSDNKQSSVDTICINENYDKTFSGEMSNNNQLKNKRWVQKSTSEGFCIPNPKNKVTQLSDIVCVNGIYYENKNDRK